MIATAAGWLLNAGHLRGVRAIALGHFTRCMTKGEMTYLDILRDHLAKLGVPILGGLPIGHHPDALTLPVGAPAALDADAGTLTVPAGW